MTSQTRNTILLCLLSGIACGLLIAGEHLVYVDLCHFGWFLYGEPGCPLTVWLRWPNWAPGIVYGFLFAIGNVGKTIEHKNLRVVLYAAISGVIFLGVWAPGWATLSYAWGASFAHFPPWPALLPPLVPGLGAVVLAFASNTLSRVQINFRGSDANPWTAGIVGACASVPFAHPYFQEAFGFGTFWAAWCILFTIWQVAVGISISLGLQRKVVRSEAAASP